MSWEDGIWCRDLSLKGLCRWCRQPVQYHMRAYCSPQCRHLFEINHFWWAAVPEALRRAGHAHLVFATCQRCGAAAWEVHHKVPLGGQIPRWATCYNHQSNLEPLCLRCHHDTHHRASNALGQRQQRDREKLKAWIEAGALGGGSVSQAPSRISRAEFESLVCNRCGDCCEQVCLRRPLDLVLSVRERKWDGQAVVVDEATVAWFLDLTYLEERDGMHLYRCQRFRREPDGTGTCTRYEERPLTCREYPYGRPIAETDWYVPRCVWKVRIEGEG